MAYKNIIKTLLQPIMSLFQLDLLKEQQSIYLDKPYGQLSKQNYISYLMFFILLTIQDIALLIMFVQYYIFIIPKLCLNIISFAIMWKQARFLKHFCVNVFLFLTKIISILFAFLIGYDYVFIILFLLEENQINEEPIENLIQRILIKLGCFLLFIFQFNILNILIMISMLLMEVLKFIYLRSKQVSKASDSNLSPMVKGQIIKSQFSNEYAMFEKIQTLPLCYAAISKQSLQITFKNQLFYNQFPQICSEEELDELILQKMSFQIISQCFDEQKTMRVGKIASNQTFITNNNFSQPSLKLIQKDDSSLKEILENYKLGKIKILNNSQASHTTTLDIYSQYFLEQNNYQAFTGQIIFNTENDDIILALIDVSKQNKLQEEKIKGEFKTSIIQSFSHELRSPLNSSLNFLQFCENDKSINEEIRLNFIEPAINALRLQSYLINDIIDFSSISSNNLELNITNVTIEQIVEEINKLFKSLLEMKNLILYVDLTENELRNVGTDFSRLMQIIANLLSNSIKFSNKGIIILKISSFSQESLKISIKDEGQGIDEDKLKLLHTMLSDVEQNRDFSQYQRWYGFGLLVSSLLLQKLRPLDYKSLQIRSSGNLKGTKITFYIQNQPLPALSSKQLFVEQPKKMLSKYRNSLQPGFNQSTTINGTIIQISELSILNKNGIVKRHQKKKNTFKSFKSCVNSATDHFIDIDFQTKFNENIFAIQDADQQNDISNESLKTIKQPTQVLSYNQVKLQDEQESEKQLKEAFKKLKCTCNKILSVDDEIFNQKSIQCLLKQHGFEVVLAFNGEEALKTIQQAKKCSPDCHLFLLILMDYQMPIMNGLKTTRVLRQMMSDKIIPFINVIGLTAFNSKNDIDCCMKSGMSAVLTKPLIVSELFEILKQL